MKKQIDEGHDPYHRETWQRVLLHGLKAVGAKVKYKFEHPEILKEFPVD